MNTQLPSNRKFGLLFTAVFLALAAYGFLKHGTSFRVIAFLIIGMLFFIVSFLRPSLLSPLNKAWFMLGQTLGKVVSPIVLGVIFFAVLTPIAIITRVSGRDELKLRRQKLDTYWVHPLGTNSDSESFKNQF